MAVPTELLEAGRHDGAGALTIFVRIVTRMLTPALATMPVVAVFAFMQRQFIESITAAALNS